MELLNATDVRKNWSVTLDSVVHDRPAYVKRTRDCIAIINMDTLSELLSGYRFIADRYVEDDDSITLSSRDLDLVVNAKDEKKAREALAKDIKEYAEDFYNNYAVWSVAPNRKPHIPYVLKALSLEIPSIEEELICHDGKR